ncbi:patatin-like phospholipase family protein [Flagellimonas nanhaiensis]|uniref:Patatin n=1 Tax=Flagellimonas nanhaiensis TaxID=2292706 RepID=A0A371JLH2_9FLAO|nr:patatin-like phospholipase family protein [Allomuricauda nanhaiensis]RDY57853.1 patatin [Allomuricauda nanhaiensis]
MDDSIGIVLSGGAARGAVHIGVLHALNENGIFPDRVAGSSAGALIGALYCGGITPIEILKLARSHRFLKVFKIGLINRGLTEMTRLKTFLQYYLEDDFDTLEVPLHISVTNLNLGKSEIIGSGQLIDVVCASCAIPLLFKPITMNGHSYVDGGLLNNLPVEPLLDNCDVVIGVSINNHMEVKRIKGALSITERCLQLAVWNTIQERLAKCHIAIETPQAFKYSAFSFKKSEELFEIGYQATLERMDEIKTRISR